MIKSLAGAALVAATFVFPTTAAAWGAQGHRITALVAEGLLTADAKAGLRTLMGKVDLAAAALVLDQQKDMLEQRMPGSRQWHYDDKPVCDTTPAAPLNTYCPGGNCASVQIRRHYLMLIDEHATLSQKRFAVNALVHLVGDIHQPLHASDHDDAGGNGVRVRFTLPSGNSQQMNLHSAWDSSFVRAAFKTADERIIAKQLLQAIDANERKDWQKGSATAWLAESYAIAQKQAYGKLPGFSCPADDFGDETVPLPDDYVRAAIGAVPQQLSKAGVRIAWLLNRAFAK